MFGVIVVLSLLCPHGGQYLPPHPEPGAGPRSTDGAVHQPGYGPYDQLQPGLWEWWFDINREELVDRRRRMRAIPAGDGTGEGTGAGPGAWAEVDDETREKDVLPVLLAALGHHNRDVRAAAAISVARLGIPSALPAVAKLTKDPDLFVRTQAVLALGFAQDPAIIKHLEAVLKETHGGSEIRMTAAVGLGLVATPESVQILARALRPATLKKQDHLLQAGYVFAAGVAGEAAPVEIMLPLMDSWLVQQDARLRSMLAIAFGRSGTRTGLKVVLKLLADPDNEVRRSAAAALEGLTAQIEEADAKVMLARAALETDLAALGNLYHALGRVGQPATRAFLQRQLTRATTLLRSDVALALALDGDPSNGDLLLECLDDQHDLSARGALFTALGMLQDPRVVPLLREELAEAREPIYQSVLCRAAGLAGVPDPDIVERLSEMADSVHHVEVARLAMLGLGLLGQRDQVVLLADAAAEVKGTSDRAGRVYAMGQVGDRNTLPPLLALAQDERQPSYVIAYAMQALGEICDPRPRSPAWRLSRHVSLYHVLPDIYELYQAL